jgi:hypothetical protein
VLKNLVPTSKKTHYISLTKINWITLLREISSVYPDIYMKPINTSDKQNSDIFSAKVGDLNGWLYRENIGILLLLLFYYSNYDYNACLVINYFLANPDICFLRRTFSCATPKLSTSVHWVLFVTQTFTPITWCDRILVLYTYKWFFRTKPVFLSRRALHCTALNHHGTWTNSWSGGKMLCILNLGSIGRKSSATSFGNCYLWRRRSK